MILHSSEKPKIYLRIVLGIILIGGLLVRLYGIDWGLPYRYNADESLFIGRAGYILRTFDFNPHWFGHPGTTTIYLLVIIYSLIYLAELHAPKK